MTQARRHLVSAAYHAVRAQLDPPMGQQLRPYDRLRRHRRDAEYPPTDAPELTPEDVEDDIPRVADIVGIAEQVLDQMSPF